MATHSKNNSLSKLDKQIKLVAGFVANITLIVGTIAGVVNWAVSPITEQLHSLEQSTTRSELLTLMANYSNDKRAIESLAYHYFAELKGDSYVYSLYTHWAKEHDVDYSNIAEIHDLIKEN